MWQELATALCLMLVIEGLVPFISPKRWRNMAEMLSKIDDRAMRIMGLVSMLIGVGLLFVVR